MSKLSVITTISIKELDKYKETQSKIYSPLFLGKNIDSNKG